MKSRHFSCLRLLPVLALCGPLVAPSTAQITAIDDSEAYLDLDCLRHFGPLTEEFRINQFQGYDQIWSSVAIAENGYVYTFSSGQDVWARFYDDTMEPVTSEFQVNTNLTNDIQDEPAIGIATTGNVLIAWSDRNGYDGEQMGIYGRIYDENAQPLGAEFQINQTWQASQWRPLISPTPTGGWVVAWTGNWDGDSFIRVLDEDGAPLTNDIRVHEYHWDAQVDPSVAVDGNGEIFVSFVDFSSHDPSASGLNLYGRSYSADGTPYQNEEFLITSWLGDGAQRQPRVAGFGTGFVVIFEDELGDGSGYGLYGRRYDGQGNALAPEFAVNTTTAGTQVACGVASTPMGEFVVAWEDYSQGPSRIAAQRFDKDGAKLGPEFIVAEDPLGRVRPVVAMDPEGEDIVISYDGSIGGWEATEAFARHYAVASGPLVFCDAKVNSAGCLPSISTSGLPSASGDAPFLISVTNVRNRKYGMLFYGEGATEFPFSGGTFCVDVFLSRTPFQFSGGGPGQNCTGTLQIDFNQIIQGSGYPGLVPGKVIAAQYLYRDPPDPDGVGLSDAVRFTICP
jgi:hypothetical protein